MRLVTRQRLLVSSAIVLLVSLFQLMAFDMWIFGSPWPIPLLWAACGWAGLGASAGTATLLFALGLWFDVVTGSSLGTWAAITLVTHAVTLLSARFLGADGASAMVHCALSGFVMLIVMAIFSIWQNGTISLVGMLTPIVTTIALYRLVGRWFELAEDET
jgi:hypothetical protein